MDFLVSPGGVVQGCLHLPGDKSISHRAAILAALAEGESEIHGFLAAHDCLDTLAVLRALGVSVEGPEQGVVRIQGVGLHGLQAPTEVLDCGNSGTAIRLLAGVLAAQRFVSELTGDASLQRRPMARIAEPLRQMGAMITTAAGGTPPLRVGGGGVLHGLDYRLPVSSAQVKSCLLLAALYADTPSRLVEKGISRDHSERMLAQFGQLVERDAAGALCLRPGNILRACRIDVPADLSAAAFFLVAASLAPGSLLRMPAVGINPSRDGVLAVLREMAANIVVTAEPMATNQEPRALLEVRSAALKGIVVAPSVIDLAIDEWPILFVAAAAATGRTVVRGASELRLKESDRLAAMAEGLRSLGIHVAQYEDGLSIDGGEIQGGCVDSHGDHRVAMAFAIAGLRARAAIRIRNCDAVATSFPDFVSQAQQVGLRIEQCD